MDALYQLSKAQFHQVATHISLYHEDASPGYRSLAEDCLRLAGLRPGRYVYWNVPNMGAYFGKTVPVDVHGGYVLVDEAAAGRTATSFGVLRYAFLSAAVRAKEGGRWRYDFTTMNVTLGAGVAAGFAALSVGRKRWGWMRRRPVGSLGVGLLVFLAATVAARQGIRVLGVGVVAAHNSHKKALTRLNCADCFDDVNRYTAQQVAELQRQELPRQPGMPPPPEEFVRRFQQGTQLQVKLLQADMDEVRAARRHIGAHFCDVHRSLREDAAAYAATAVLPISPADVQRASERAQAEAAESLEAKSE
ncbi:uncharacterized protein Tco025E_02498 [Trypanosoma conorhini]|uniref:Transmembrane protein n=1 Tax=Trypanosoma conorhini TaxID=83891 RepID=A0A3R7PGA6_9TRYP|nr:uncharacterized protein Tco025E_02498 [Trypanosoma conorhini]RNF24885.1 hypothetical protein Tco025E_02498 [Trypanosoma conorhini]